MIYPIQKELKERGRAVGLRTRELAEILGEPPGTVAGRLNGFIPLSRAQYLLLDAKIRELEAQAEPAAGPDAQVEGPAGNPEEAGAEQ